MSWNEKNIIYKGQAHIEILHRTRWNLNSKYRSAKTGVLECALVEWIVTIYGEFEKMLEVDLPLLLTVSETAPLDDVLGNRFCVNPPCQVWTVSQEK